MSSPVQLRRPAALAAIASSLLTVLLIDPRPAAAHGSAIDPPSRQYGCARRWDTEWQNPIMATQDPMCWQAWQANPAAMWTWNGLIQNNVNDDHQARVPDGHLCGGGDDTYAALDTPGFKPTGQWAGGFQGDVTVTAAAAPVQGWTVTLQFPNGQTIGQSWGADVSADGPNFVARNVNYNGILAAGASTTFGVLGTWLATNNPPLLSCSATV